MSGESANEDIALHIVAFGHGCEVEYTPLEARKAEQKGSNIETC